MKVPSVEFIKSKIKNIYSILKRDYPDFFQYISGFRGNSFAEKLYIYFYGDCTRCHCGNPVKFISFNKGYQKYCSIKCANSDPDKITKQLNTCNHKYNGVGYASSQIKNKIVATNKKLYGTDHPLKNQEILSKIQQTCMQRYGVPYVLCRGQKRDEINKTRRELFINDSNFIIETHGLHWVCKCPHPNCKKCNGTFITTGKTYYNRLRDQSEQCTVLFPIGSHIPAQSTNSSLFFDEIDKYLPGQREFQIGPYKVDWIYQNIIVEFYGDYWHANPAKYSNDWVHPVKKCTAQEIWEYDLNRMEYLLSIGYDVYIVWESDIGTMNISEFVHKICGEFTKEN